MLSWFGISEGKGQLNIRWEREKEIEREKERKRERKRESWSKRFERDLSLLEVSLECPLK